MHLLPGHYTVEGVALVEDSETRNMEGIPFSAEFYIYSSDTVELYSSVMGIRPPVMTESNGTSLMQARYTNQWSTH